jgi:hypothetical protein
VHLLFPLLILAIVGVLIYCMVVSRRPKDNVQGGAQSPRGFAFRSNGLLFVRESGEPVKQLHSAYIKEATERRERARDRHGWKQGTSFQIAAGGGARNFDAGDVPIVTTAATFASDGSLFYALRDDNVGGLFRRAADTGNEQRLLLRQQLSLNDFALSPDGTTLAASSEQSGGVAQITLINVDGSGYRPVTAGDTIDTAPAWIPSAPQKLLFQSAGLARDERGWIVARGPTSIQKLDMESSELAPILDDPKFDFLKPRVTSTGHLLFIRRPYEASHYSPQSALLDTVLFPFRLLRAVFHYLNFFSLMYTRKPLTSATGPTREADMKNMMVQGRRIDAERALRTARQVQGVPSLVPDNWQLMQRDLEGNDRVLATNVMSYDLALDGTIVYSNGQGVFVLDANGQSSVALSGQLVTEVFAAAR